MTPLPLVLATALMLGALHAFDPDHLAAVTAFVARRPSAGAAAGFAARWGAGHAASLLAAGLVTALLRKAIAPGLQTVLELSVGVVLVVVGVWAIAGAGSRGPRRPAGSARRSAEGGRPLFWIGALHGLAGSAALLVVVPVALMESAWGAWGVPAYILAFSAGVIGAMTLYAMAIGGLFGRVAGGAAGHWYPWLSGAAGAFTLLLGLTWISLTVAVAAAS